MFQLSDVEANESAFVVWWCRFCEVMAGAPVVASRAGAIIGRSPPDLVLCESWQRSIETCEVAIRGRRTRFAFGMSGSVFSIFVSSSC